MGQPTKKTYSELYIFTPLSKCLAQNSNILIATEIQELCQHLGNWHLMAHQMAQW